MCFWSIFIYFFLFVIIFVGGKTFKYGFAPFDHEKLIMEFLSESVTRIADYAKNNMINNFTSWFVWSTRRGDGPPFPCAFIETTNTS